jgi:ParB-like chromosome segregation protein Spo0J
VQDELVDRPLIHPDALARSRVVLNRLRHRSIHTWTSTTIDEGRTERMDNRRATILVTVDRLPVEVLPISSLLPGDSPRISGENSDHVRTLAQSEGQLPPVTVHRASMRVIDGMHRLHAAQLRGDSEIEVRLFDGDEESAFVLAVQSNIAHGLPLTLADRVAAATRIFKANPGLSDRSIASATGLAAATVAGIRERATDECAQLNARIGRDGKVRPLSSAEGRRLASELIGEKPDASLREIAREAGVSPATVRDVRKRLGRGDDPVPPQCENAERAGGADAPVPKRSPP